MYGKRQRVPHAEHGGEGVGTETQVGMFAQKLQALFFGLEGELLGVAVAKNLNICGFHFHPLAFSLAFHQQATRADGCAEFDALHQRRVGIFKIEHHLQIGGAGAVVEGNELVVAEGFDPAFYKDIGVDWFGAEYFGDFRAFHTSFEKNWAQR